MGKLFGTDGIRGIANETLTCDLAYRVGQATAICLRRAKGSAPTVVLGKDTRISSDMLEGALVAGLCASGANAVHLGVLPTPAVAYLTVFYHADAGVMISASHNPYEYNGIKIFSSQGFKLSDDLEEEIEALVLSDEPLAVEKGEALGRLLEGLPASEYYIRHLASTVSELSDLHVLIDCANGAASTTAQRLFNRYNISAPFINDRPDGVNINRDCGSTHLEQLSQRVKNGYYDLGIAFDGDADRCLVVDENGNPVDGDQIMAICARHMRRENRLKGNGFVATVMSNLGLHKYCEDHDLRLLCADVGDRNVLDLMRREGMVLGGEQSGHVIFLDDMPTGDGQLTALHFLKIVCETRQPVSRLAAEVTQYPQVLINVPAPHDLQARKALLYDAALLEAKAKAEATLGKEGRILVRASGTEALIRVMVEAPEEAVAKDVATQMANTVENLQK